MWYCPKCDEYIVNEEVSYEETHDREIDTYTGEKCGADVEWRSQQDMAAAEAAAAPNTQKCIDCGSPHLIPSGTCFVCAQCGATTVCS